MAEPCSLAFCVFLNIKYRGALQSFLQSVDSGLLPHEKTQMSKEIQLEVSLSESAQEEVALAILPKVCLLTDFPRAKLIPDQNSFRPKDSIS